MTANIEVVIERGTERNRIKSFVVMYQPEPWSWDIFQSMMTLIQWRVDIGNEFIYPEEKRSNMPQIICSIRE